MLTRTTLLGIRILMRLAQHEGDEPVTPARLAKWLAASPSYIAKVSGLLVHANLLESYRGAHGGPIRLGCTARSRPDRNTAGSHRT